ncbi:hypothetical protein MTR67_030609 [Solanum verrucosum]|uniref:Gag-pol polyprotein n=1 Tax=Solanum verrucosum TaxID=315347 RepID=A0AAF0TYH0_SOLVR|nr:hypothetical protein MTR67_030609 [Solanum verrucosum]
MLGLGWLIAQNMIEIPMDCSSILVNLLAEQVTHAELRVAFQVLSQALKAQANRKALNALVNPNVGTTTSKIRDFTRMNPLKFHGSKVDEDPQEFIDEVYKIRYYVIDYG